MQMLFKMLCNLNKISFKSFPLKRVILASLMIFVLFSQPTFAEGEGWGSLWTSVTNVTDAVAGFKALFSTEGIIEVFIRLVNFAIDSVLSVVLDVSGWVFDWSLDLVINSDTSVVESGWNKSLSIANNLFILILLGIAIGTILGLTSFNYKTMMAKFLMVAILINFSMAIGNVIIGATNVLTSSFYSQIKGNTSKISEIYVKNAKVLKPAEESAKHIKTRTDSGDNLKDLTKEASSFIFIFIYKIFTYLVSIFMFLTGAAYMITRTFYLWLLLMIAPLAWIALLIPHPNIQQQWKAWWDKFIKWSIFAPAYLFFLWLGTEISTNSAIPAFISSTNSGRSGFTNIAGSIIQMLTVAFIMTAGLLISDKLGVGGSNFVINYGKNLKGAASKRFSELRGKTPLSAENIGKKFGTFGSAITTLGGKAPLGVGGQYKEVIAKEKFTKAKEIHETASYAQLSGTYMRVLATRTVNPDQAAQIKELLSRSEAERVANGIPPNLGGNISDLRLAVRAGMRGDTTF